MLTRACGGAQGLTALLSHTYCHCRFWCRRHSSQHPSIRDSRDPPSRNERRSQGDRSPRNHRESGGRRHRSRSRSTDTGSRKRRKESGFSGEAAAAPPHVAGDPTSAAAAGWCHSCLVVQPNAMGYTSVHFHQCISIRAFPAWQADLMLMYTAHLADVAVCFNLDISGSKA